MLTRAKTVEQGGEWKQSYQKEATPSWAKHGMPDLFAEFLDLLQKQERRLHLDIGCGDGTKTIEMARAGQLSVLGIDSSAEAINKALAAAAKLNGRSANCRFIQKDALCLPVSDHEVTSASDILVSTHFPEPQFGDYLTELKRVLDPQAYLLLVLFSSSDKHFHGRPLNGQRFYTYSLSDVDPSLEPDFLRYAHYEGMYNTHYSGSDIEKTYGRSFQIVKMTEVNHPVYAHRKLWNVILRNTS